MSENIYIFKEKVAKIFSNLVKTINPQLQEVQKFQVGWVKGVGGKRDHHQITEKQQKEKHLKAMTEKIHIKIKGTKDKTVSRFLIRKCINQKPV